MGLDFSALMKYDGPTGEVLGIIERLETQKVDLPLQPVLDYGRAQGYRFALPGSQEDTPRWERLVDLERLPRRPALPSLEAWLELPSRFCLVFGADTVWVYHTVRWQVFLTDPGWRDVLLAGTRHLCRTLRASGCIVTRDEHPAIEAFCNGAAFAEALHAPAAENDGLVEDIDDMYIDAGYAEDLYAEDAPGLPGVEYRIRLRGDGGPEAEGSPIRLWDTRGYWRLAL